MKKLTLMSPFGFLPLNELLRCFLNSCIEFAINGKIKLPFLGKKDT